MKLGIGSFAYPWAIGIPGFPMLAHPMNAFGLLDAAKHLGVSVVQYVDNLPLTALTVAELDRLLGQATDAGIALEIGMRGTDAPTLREYLRLAKRIGSPFVRVIIDRSDDKPSVPEVIARLKLLVPAFADAGIKLAIENFDRFPAQTFAEIVEALGTEHAGICLDTVNSLGALEGPNLVCETLAPYVVNLHVKDVIIRRHPHQLGFVVEGRPAGQGQVDLPGIFRRLPPDISAILELWTVPGDDPIEEITRREAQWVEESIGYLRGLELAP